MNSLELRSYIHSKKISKKHFEEELHNIQIVSAQLKIQKPVKWYHNAYYVIKRVVFLALASVCVLILLSSFTNETDYHQLFDNKLSPHIEKIIDGTFGSSEKVTYSNTSAVDSYQIEKSQLKPVREDIQTKISLESFKYLSQITRVLLLMGAFLFWYIARLTRKMHMKNKIITNYYNSNLLILDLHQKVLEEQNYEIQFLSKISKQAY